jgi:hypothetical protein
MIATVSEGHVRVDFAPGTAAASDTPPGPGQCTWLDRGFRSGEPTNMGLDGDLAATHYLVDAAFGASAFYVQAYNNGHGVMVITHIGP